MGASSGSDEASAAEVGDGCGPGASTAIGAARPATGPDGVTTSEGDAPSDTEAEAGAARSGVTVAPSSVRKADQ